MTEKRTQTPTALNDFATQHVALTLPIAETRPRTPTKTVTTATPLTTAMVVQSNVRTTACAETTTSNHFLRHAMMATQKQRHSVPIQIGPVIFAIMTAVKRCPLRGPIAETGRRQLRKIVTTATPLTTTMDVQGAARRTTTVETEE
jgi:hypothetical protein